ncbi:MAG: ribonuclease P protein component [Flavobacteriia bacterium]
MDQSFGKAYKLCSKKAIDSLFVEKRTVKNYPFVLNYAFQELDTEKSFQVVISAPKKIFRKAHERNRIKRLMKEVIRKKKLILENYLEENKKQLAIFLIYTVKEELKYQVLENKMEQLLNKLVNELKVEK